ncbi:hypothetical protein LJC37_00720 [Bacteroidales bacterium OttesenSCG-928-E04]|nr:hypothetical protein [Bacteroidales bacterium OttesenSCG-928-E04]
MAVIPYGPLAESEETEFMTCCQFVFPTEAKAFACQKGMIFIQEASANHVNLILKPTSSLDIEFSPVKYYIYRGLLKNSFLNGANIKAKGVNESEFINKFWSNWEKHKINVAQPNLPDPTPKSLGYDSSLSGDENVEKIFNNSLNDVKAVLVGEGEWLGNFDTAESSFEVVIDTDHFDVDLSFLRDVKSSVVFTASPDDEFRERVEREKILSFIDPAAFFGMHYKVGVKISTYISSEKQTVVKKKDDLYVEVIAKFPTKNRVYIDIRNERGYSYNFYRNYGDENHHLLKLKARSASNFMEDSYYTYKWPIFFADNPIETDGKFNKIEMQLRVDDNIKPLLFLRDPELSRKLKRRHFIDEKALLDGIMLDWSKSVMLKFPNTGTAPSKENVAWHIQLQYFRQDDIVGDKDLVPQNESFQDRLFLNIGLPSKDGALDVFQHLQASRYTLVNGDDFTYVSCASVYKDIDDVVFCMQPEYVHTESKNAYTMISNLKKSQRNPLIASPVFPINTKFQRINVKENDNDVFIISISNVNRDGKTTKKESLFLLGITNDELYFLTRAANTLGLSEGHARSIVFSEIQLGEIERIIPYRKYELNVRGLDDEGGVKTTTSTEVFVYTLDGHCFNSEVFGRRSNIALGLPDPGIYREFDYCHRILYNKNHTIVTSSPTLQNGIVTVPDFDNDYDDDEVEVELRGDLLFPIDKIGDTQISNKRSSYPLIIIIHGNGQNYMDYERDANLCSHLAKNGFITLSIDCLITKAEVKLTPYSLPPFPYDYVFQVYSTTFFYNKAEKVLDYVSNSQLFPSGLRYDEDFAVDLSDSPKIIFLRNRDIFEGSGMAAFGRSNLLYPHLKLIKDYFNNRVEDNIGIMGHSRGGEAVVRAAKDIGASSAPINLRKINAIISLAPTDQYEEECLTQDISYFVLYGSKDGDVSGATRHSPNYTNKNTGSGAFSLYDRAINNSEKSMAFVYGATHNGFITTNEDYPDDKATEDIAVQRAISRAYVNAFFRMFLKNEDVWKPIFSGSNVPDTITKENIIHLQCQNFANRKHIASTTEELYDLISADTGFEFKITEFDLRGIKPNFNFDKRADPFSPHFYSGIFIKYPSTGGKITITIPAAKKNASNYSFISFRICHVSGEYATSSKNKEVNLFKIYNNLDNLAIEIEDSSSTKYTMPINKSIPSPDKRINITRNGRNDFEYLTKSALITIRMPLINYKNENIDLRNIKYIKIVFPSTSEDGFINIDTVEYTN